MENVGELLEGILGEYWRIVRGDLENVGGLVEDILEGILGEC